MKSEVSRQWGKDDFFKGGLNQYSDLFHVIIQYSQSGGFKN